MDEIKLGEQIGKLIESNDNLVKRFDQFDETLPSKIEEVVDRHIWKYGKKALIYILPSGGILGIIAWITGFFRGN